ncbi:MAG: hypothetical protein RSE14_00555 [Erythrobacter sp.]|jgi:uncharacterized membrane protein|uniref:hypothetical protein n=1 Tax=Erythrobacter sp. TaxID=1042 RepID=UPI002B46ABA5|nr:hypothetical protein [Erythrobacter sp.]WRH70615.1 MAG: hypothetical protein RSE14_00555 [Erythrobacter sp.]
MQAPAPLETDRTARLRLALERELRPGESVLWHGWQLARIDPRQFLGYVFAIPWTAFSLAWTGIAVAAVASAGPGENELGLVAWAFPLFGLPFVAVGAWMLGQPFKPLRERGRVLYVITDERVLKLSLARALDVTAVPAARIGMAERREQRDGTGILQLAVKVGIDSDGDRQTEHFVIGAVEDVMGAQEALNRIATVGRDQPVMGALSS